MDTLPVSFKCEPIVLTTEELQEVFKNAKTVEPEIVDISCLEEIRQKI